MSAKSYPHYFASLWLQGTEDALTFELGEAAFSRFNKVFEQKRTGFFIFATISGHTCALNLAYLQMAKFFTCAAHTPTEIKPLEDRSPEVMLYFINRNPLSLQAKDPRDLALIFQQIKPAQDREALRFSDLAGSEIKLFTTDLVLVKTATQFVEEGFLALHLAKKQS